MSEPLSAERLAEIRARADAATEGPWWDWDGCVWTSDATCLHDVILSGDRGSSADLEFIAAARQDIPDLLAEVDRLAAENARLTVVVERVRERRRLGEGMQRIQFPSRWFSAAHDEPGERLPSHDDADHGHDATPADERGRASAFRQSSGTDPAWDGTGE